MNGPNFSMFLLVVQFMMKIKFDFNNFIYFMACLIQPGSVPATYDIQPKSKIVRNRAVFCPPKLQGEVKIVPKLSCLPRGISRGKVWWWYSR